MISQIEFTLDGNAYTYRAAATAEAMQTDISGVYDELNKTAELSVKDNVTLGGAYSLRYAQGETKGLATWYYAPTGCQYSLWTTTGCDISQQIEEVVDALLPIAADAQGNPLTPAVSTPLPVVNVSKVTGKVADIQANTILVQLDNSNTLQFMLSNIKTPEAKVGDEVEISYSGNPLDAPEAISITVIASAPAAPTISGTVFRYTKQSVFVQIADSNLFGFVIDANTAFKGQSQTLKTGNQVTVIYSGELSNAPVATIIDTTTVSSEPESTAEPSDPVNKSLRGTVTDLTSKRVSVRTDTGHDYTFRRDGSTVMTGNYALQYGSYIRVHYDGYASKGPLAKRIDVLSPPDPTPPDPTPYVPTTYTISGTIIMTAGNALAVRANNGSEYSFLLRSPSISGDVVEGYGVSVTYRVESDGSLNATRIVTTPPIVYEAGPQLYDAPVWIA